VTEFRTFYEFVNVEGPTSNNVFCQLKKDVQSKTILRDLSAFGRFNSAESFDPEFFNPGLTTEGLVSGCDSLVLDSIKRSAINIRRSMLEVRCSTFKAYRPPLKDLLCRPGGVSH
jgi:hypothetical protein